MPLGYFFYITDTCNLDCDYCWQRAENSVPNVRPELSLDEWLKVTDSLPRFSYVGLTGGEVTTFKELNTLVKYIKQSHLLTINTNGLSLDYGHLSTFVSSSLNNLSISMDGFADGFDRARDCPGLFDKIVENIHLLNQLKLELNKKTPALTIKAVILDECVDELEKFYDFCTYELKADNLNLSFMKTTDHAQFDTRILNHMDQVFSKGRPRMYPYKNKEKIIKVLLRLLEKSETRSCAISLFPKMRTEGELRNMIESEGVGIYKPCNIPWAMMVISPTGDVIPCLSLSMGNLRDNEFDIKKCFQGAKYQEFLNWLEEVNNTGKTSSACNMCCYLDVESN